MNMEKIMDKCLDLFARHHDFIKDKENKQYIIDLFLKLISSEQNICKEFIEEDINDPENYHT